MKETLTEQEYLETVVKELHNEIELDKQKAFMHKKMYGTWTAEEIINAMKSRRSALPNTVSAPW